MKTLRLNKQESQIVLPEGVTLVKTRNPKSMYAAAQGTYLRAMLGDVQLRYDKASMLTSAVSRRAFARDIAIAFKKHSIKA